MADQFIYSMTDTWNDGGTTWVAIKMNVTDSASASDSKLIQLQVGGNERFSVGKNGNMTLISGDAGAAGPVLTAFHDSASPEAGDKPFWLFASGRDSLGNVEDYAEIYAEVTDPTSGSEDAVWVFRSKVAGVMTTLLSLGGEGDLRLVSTDPGAGAGPVLNLYRDSASPAADDLIGRVLFQGEDSVGNTEDYAEVVARIDDPTSTSEDASLLFRTKVAGAMVTAMTITGGQVSFANGLVAQDTGSSTAGIGLAQRASGFSETIKALNAAGTGYRGAMGWTDADGFYIRAGDDVTNDLTLSPTGALTITGGLTLAGTISGATTVAATSFSGSGASLTSLNASNVSSGTLSDARLSSNVPLKNTDGTITGNWDFNNSSPNTAQLRIFTGLIPSIASLTGLEQGLQIFNSNNNSASAVMAFHRGGSFAAYFGLDTDNQFKVGGWSMGANAYKIWHAGNDGAGSGLDADRLDGQQGAFYQNASNINAGTLSSNRLGGDVWRNGNTPSANVLWAAINLASNTISFQTPTGGNTVIYRQQGIGGTPIRFTNQSGDQTQGSISVNNNNNITTYNTSSDHRLKDDIATLEGSGERIDAVNPRAFTWNTSGMRSRGFIAHEFAEVYPNSVTGEKDAVDEDGNPVYQGIDAGTPEIIADIFSELQSLRRRVTSLEMV